jgi:hypothetical protein
MIIKGFLLEFYFNTNPYNFKNPMVFWYLFIVKTIEVQIDSLHWVTYKCVFGNLSQRIFFSWFFFPDSWSESGMFCYSLVVIFQVLGTWCLCVCWQWLFSPFSL